MTTKEYNALRHTCGKTTVMVDRGNGKTYKKSAFDSDVFIPDSSCAKCQEKWARMQRAERPMVRADYRRPSLDEPDRNFN